MSPVGVQVGSAGLGWICLRLEGLRPTKLFVICHDQRRGEPAAPLAPFGHVRVVSCD